jgi:hypothetical protein
MSPRLFGVWVLSGGVGRNFPTAQELRQAGPIAPSCLPELNVREWRPLRAARRKKSADAGQQVHGSVRIFFASTSFAFTSFTRMAYLHGLIRRNRHEVRQNAACSHLLQVASLALLEHQPHAT